MNWDEGFESLGEGDRDGKWGMGVGSEEEMA